MQSNISDEQQKVNDKFDHDFKRAACMTSKGVEIPPWISIKTILMAIKEHMGFSSALTPICLFIYLSIYLAESIPQNCPDF